jgi:acylphosphatase
MIAKKIFYEGRVQGVGFRWTVRELANQFEVAGTVRNLDDGRVELCVMGEEAEVAAFLAAIRASGLAKNIRFVTEFPWNPDDPPKGFRIL